MRAFCIYVSINTHTHTHTPIYTDAHRYTRYAALTLVNERLDAEHAARAAAAAAAAAAARARYIHRDTHRHTPINTDIYTDICTETEAMLHGGWRASAARDLLLCCCTRALCANTELCYAKALARAGAML